MLPFINIFQIMFVIKTAEHKEALKIILCNLFFQFLDEFAVRKRLDLTGKVLYLGSCSTLNVNPERLERFRRDTGLRMVCGYKRPVD